jgi:hypothetical protein
VGARGELAVGQAGQGTYPWQVVRDRMALSSHVQSLLATLGLRRKAKRVKTLDA